MCLFVALSPTRASAECATTEIDVLGDGTQCETAKFSVTTISTNQMDFRLTAVGTFYVDWGDGSAVETITRADTTTTAYSHTYDTSDTYTIRFGGVATAYETNPFGGAIDFYKTSGGASQNKVAEISGSLGALFPQYGANAGQYPSFASTFEGQTSLSSIPAGLFSGLTGGRYMFLRTFYECTGISSLPANLFSNITTGAEDMFYATFQGCTGLNSIPANFFARITTGAIEMFRATFAGCTGLRALPSGLFKGLTTAASDMFTNTFNNCKYIHDFIPKSMFAGLVANGSPTAPDMWSGTFNNDTYMATSCSSPYTQYTTGYESYWGGKVSCSRTCAANEIDVYGDGVQCETSKFEITTTSNTTKFQFVIRAAGTFYVDWGDGSPVQILTYASAGNSTGVSHTFPSSGSYTIRFGGLGTSYPGCGGDESTLDFTNNGWYQANVASVSGSLGALLPQYGTAYGQYPCFLQQFSGCTNLTSIPSTLFSGITGGVQYMFYTAFNNCTKLTSLPAGLFDDITTGALSQFALTFKGCTRLASIPDGLFSNITTVTGSNLFNEIFRNCTALTSLPENLFSGITTAHERLFSYAFDGCTNLSGAIPLSTFSGLLNNNTPFASNMFSNTFNGTALNTSCGANEVTYAVYKPYWSGKVVCRTACPAGQIATGTTGCEAEKFSLTTTSDTTSFSFNMTARGTFYVDWGDGTVQTIDRSNNNQATYSHTYSTAGAYTIRFGGTATLYSTTSNMDYRTAAIGFYYPSTGTQAKIASVSGSLGAMFPILGSAANQKPKFTQTFMSATNLAEIPSTLFSGLVGGPYMFDSTFKGCTGLTTIAPTLFQGATTGAERMFRYTFQNCTGLTTIPDGLFSYTTTSGDRLFHGTFAGCAGLTALPENLFAGLTNTAGYMFMGTFNGCSNLTGFIPPSFVSGLIARGSPKPQGMWDSAFANTALLTECPAGYAQYITGYEGTSGANVWNGKVSCVPCAAGTARNEPGLGACPACAVGTYSGAGATTCTACTNGPANSTYTDNATTNACPFDCDAGYSAHEESVPDLSTAIGTVTGNYIGYISNDGNNQSNASTYGLTENGTFAVEYSNNKGTLKGIAQCSSQVGTNNSETWSNPTISASLPDASGVYCYCKLDKYNGQSFPMSWMFYNSYGSNSSCAQYCAGACAGYLAYTHTNALAFRSAMFNAVQPVTTCEICANGTYAAAGSSSCTACPTVDTGYEYVSGTGWTGYSDCQEQTRPANCYSGYLTKTASSASAWGTATTTLTANAGYEVTGSGNATTCTACAAGYYSTDGDTTCTVCSNANPAHSTYITPATSSTCPWECESGYINTGTSCETEKFSVTTTSNATTLKFALRATGDFYVDCGDGGTLTQDTSSYGTLSGKTISRTSTGTTWYTCTWGSAGVHHIKFSGTATGYQTNLTSPIGFYLNNGNTSTKIASISGSLAALFPQLGNSVGQYPKFYQTFRGASNMTGIPGTLFTGLTGGAEMFRDTFYGCSSVQTIPDNLFSTITNGADSIFLGTFLQCSGVTAIPSTLFSHLSGNTSYASMFQNTFWECTGLTSVPADLFSHAGTGATSLFQATFYGCTGLTSIPAGLFSTVTGAYENQFKGTFQGCTNLAGYIPKTTFAGLIANDSPSPSNNKTMWDNTFLNTNVATSCSPYTGMTQFISGYEGETNATTWNTRVSCQTCAEARMFTGTNGQCEPSKFEVTTTNDTSMFKFQMSVKGTFYVDWGDGNVQTLEHANANTATYTHTYDTTGSYTIRFGGLATGYQTGNGPTITFYNETNGTQSKIAGISGSLAAIFPEIGTPTATSIGTHPLFRNTFEGAVNLTSIPDTLFRGLHGGYMMFYQTFYGCTGLTSIPATLFTDINIPAQSMFASTFYNTGITSIPETLFDTVTSSEKSMFNYTFAGCSGLSSIPADLFSHITTGSDFLFDYTFAWCTGLTTVPATLFNRVTTGGESTFRGVFYGCTGLTSVPGNLFSGLTSTTGATNMFKGAFSGCTSLASVPATLFNKVSTGENYMFQETFKGCSALTTVPAELFSGISTGATGLFSRTFENCTGLTSVPPGLFSGITTSANSMFSGTFKGCNHLAALPDTLFSGITTGANYMFNETFNGCSGLSGFVPPTLFSGLIANSSPYSTNMMQNVFNGSTLLTACPAGYTQYITGYEDYWSSKVSCEPCAAGTYKSGSGNGACTACSVGTYMANTGATACTACTNKPAHSSYSTSGGTTNTCDWECDSGYINTGTSCEEPKFSVTTTSNATSFVWTMSATGEFYVDCGDGGTLTQSGTTTDSTLSGNTITRTGISDTTYTCTWDSAGAHTVRFGGTATGYNTSTSVPTISFYQFSGGTQAKVASVSGSLGAMFPVVNGNIPRFYQTFYNCNNLTSIPANLFNGIDTSSVTDTSSMFQSTFSGCSSLTSIPAGLFSAIDTSAATNTSEMFSNTFKFASITSIPSDLFSTIDTSSATNTSSMFINTFYGCTNLSSIPAGLFSAIDTSSATNTSYMFDDTFYGCSSLTSIPADLFSAVDTSSATDTLAMFQSTFSGCSNLSSIPAGLFSAIDTSSATNTRNMFSGTFARTGITSIPAGLFSGIDTSSVTDTSRMFQSTFNGCSNLTGYIPPTTFPNTIQPGSSSSSNMWYRTFYNTQLLTACPMGTGQYITGFESDWGYSNGNVPSDDGSTRVSCEPCPGTLPEHASYTTAGTCDWVCDSGYINTGTSCEESTFSVTTTSDATSLVWTMTAKGTFYADCGDGGTLTQSTTSYGTLVGNKITRTKLSTTAYTCTWNTAAAHTVHFAGNATEYNTGTQTAAISFYKSGGTQTKVASVSGSLGSMFPVVSGQIPRFSKTFYGCNKLTSISSTLFSGINTSSVTDTSYMFYNMFTNCSSLVNIPAGLFSTIDTSSATNTSYMFATSFYGCRGLTGIPSGLFSEIDTSSATNTSGMFSSTFYGCSKLESVPSVLFSEIDTSSATNTSNMFGNTFYGCNKLTTVPVELFSAIDTSSATDTSNMFNGTFNSCLNLETIPAGLFSAIDTSSATNTSNMFSGSFYGCSKLSAIPSGLFSEIDTSSATNVSSMFQNTFSGCSRLTTIPAELFSEIDTSSATNVSSMFNSTFNNCSAVTSMPAGLFSTIDTSSATDTSYMFYNTFAGCSNMSSYIPPTTFPSTISTGSSSSTDMWAQAFNNTGLATECPMAMTQYITGFESDWNGKVSCEPCPMGTYKDVVGNQACSACPNGTYMSDTGATACVACTNKPANSVYTGNATSNSCPYSCNAGYTNSNNLCEACAAGTYKGTVGNEACAAASAGYFAAGTANTAQTLCAAGSYTDTTGQAACTACQNGTTNTGTDATSQQACGTTCSNATNARTDNNSLTWETATWANNSVTNACTLKTTGCAANYYYDTNACVSCPTPADHKRTTFPANYYEPTIDSVSFASPKGISSISSCRVIYWASGTRGRLYDYSTYNTTTSKYDTSTNYGWSDVNAGYYLTTKGSCGTYAYYKDANVCPAGSYCPGKARVTCNASNQETVHTTTFGLNDCATDTTNYANSAEGTTTIDNCYLTTTATNYVATAGAGETTCAAGGYCAGGTDVYYNTDGGAATGGMTVCAANSYSNAGASSCTACATTKGYGNSGDNVANHAGVTSCTVTCPGGSYVATAGAGCVNVGAGNWGAGGTVTQTGTLARTSCATGLTTIGYGPGADEAGDCGHKFHAGDGILYLRSVKKTTPSLNVRIGNAVFYGNMSTLENIMSAGSTRKLKINNGGTIYHVHDDSVDLPSGYTQVAYVQSSGNQAIDTGIIMTNAHEVRAKFNPSALSKYLYGSVSSGNSTSYTAYLSSAGNWRFGNRTIAIPTSANTLYESVQNSSGVTINGVSKGTYASTTFTSPNSLVLFGSHSTANAVSPNFSGKVYYIKIYNNGDAVFDGIPAKRNSDNKCGLYDMANNVFYASHTATAFICP